MQHADRIVAELDITPKQLNALTWVKFRFAGNEGDDPRIQPCFTCDSVDVLYSYGVFPNDVEISFFESQRGMCAKCVTYNAYKKVAGMVRMPWNTGNEAVCAFPIDELPKQDVHKEIGKCVCGVPVYDTATGNYVKVTAQDLHGDEYTAHKGCVRECEECNKLYVYSTFFWTTNQATDVDPMPFPRYEGCENTCRTCVLEIAEREEMTKCNSCDSYEYDSNLFYSERNDGIYLCMRRCATYPITCDDCDNDYREIDGHECSYQTGSPTIRSYGYKPNAKFFGNAPYHLGFELEVENSSRECDEEHEYDCDSDCLGDSDHDDVLNVIHEACGPRVYMKEDASLDNGFEIVSHPHSLDEYHTKFDWTWLDGLRSNGYLSWNRRTCGLHVHIGKVAFEKDSKGSRVAHEVRFTKFIYDNEMQVERISGRGSNTYATFADKGNIVRKVKFQDQRDSRYSVVNVYNESTYEVRIFRGSLRKERVLSGIEFVQAVAEHTRNMKVVAKHKPFAWSHFVSFVVNNAETYPNLLTIINESFERVNAETYSNREEA